jgi:hypothetical protein
MEWIKIKSELCSTSSTKEQRKTNKYCAKCESIKSFDNFYTNKNAEGRQSRTCKSCLNEFKKEKVECEICNTITTRNYYYQHIKKHQDSSKVILENGKICTKCKIDKALDDFHNDSSKKDGKYSICKDCRKNGMD